MSQIVRRPWTQRIFDLIDEGVHDVDEIVERSMYYVPLGHAYRTREKHLTGRTERRDRRRGAPSSRAPTRRSVDHHEAYKAGARRVVRRTLQTLRRGKLLVIIDGELHRNISKSDQARPDASEITR